MKQNTTLMTNDENKKSTTSDEVEEIKTNAKTTEERIENLEISINKLEIKIADYECMITTLITLLVKTSHDRNIIKKILKDYSDVVLSHNGKSDIQIGQRIFNEIYIKHIMDILD